MKKHRVLKNITLKLKEPTYGSDITIVVGDDKYYLSIIKKLNILDREPTNVLAAETAELIDSATGVITYMLRFREVDFTTQSYGELVHETLHLACRILDNIGFKFVADNLEPLNYLQERLFMNLLDGLMTKYYKIKQ